MSLFSRDLNRIHWLRPGGAMTVRYGYGLLNGGIPGTQ